jgi:Domain of unknown function (DUF4388)
MDPRFLVDQRGALTLAEGQASPLVGKTGYFRLQNTSPDFLLFLRSPAQGGVQEKKPRLVLAGDAGTFPLSDLIAFLGQARWSGVLRVTAAGSERSLLLKDGEVRSAASDAPADRIGEVMVRMGFVSRAQLDHVLNEAPPSRLGKVLVERGVIKAHDLYRCLNEQISEIFHGIMLTREGSFALIDQDIEDKALTHNLSLSMQGLLMDSIRKIDELAQFRKRIPHSRVYVVRKKPSDGTLEAEEEHLLTHVDGAKTLLELGQLSKVSEFEATRIVYRLLEGGYAALSQSPVTLEPAPAVPVTQSGVAQVPIVGALPPRALDEHKVLGVFNVIFREVRDEVARRGNLDMFIASANAALKGNGVSTSPVLTNLAFRDDGTLDDATMLAQYQQLRTEGQMGSEPLMSLKQALSDVMFFLLFQAGELLESRADEDLARRVKELLATIDSK